MTELLIFNLCIQIENSFISRNSVNNEFKKFWITFFCDPIVSQLFSCIADFALSFIHTKKFLNKLFPTVRLDWLQTVGSNGRRTQFFAVGSKLFDVNEALCFIHTKYKISTDWLQTDSRLASDSKIGVNGTMLYQCNPTAFYQSEASLKRVGSQSEARRL